MLKKVIIFILLTILPIFAFGQINVIFLEDVPKEDRISIVNKLDSAVRINIKDSVKTFQTIEMSFNCTDSYNANKVLDNLDFGEKIIIITFQKLRFECTDEELDGLNIGNGSIITRYNVFTNERLIKTALHELGHMRGLLPHCNNKLCFMYGGGTQDQLAIYDSQTSFCKKCNKIINK